MRKWSQVYLNKIKLHNWQSKSCILCIFVDSSLVFLCGIGRLHTSPEAGCDHITPALSVRNSVVTYWGWLSLSYIISLIFIEEVFPIFTFLVKEWPHKHLLKNGCYYAKATGASGWQSVTIGGCVMKLCLCKIYDCFCACDLSASKL